MKVCKCGEPIVTHKVIDGKMRNLQNRTKCLDCLPFNTSRYRKKTEAERRARANRNAKKYYEEFKEKTGLDRLRVIRDERKSEVLALVNRQCQLCSYTKLQRNLAFHHLRDKSFDLSSRSFQYSLDKVLEEVKKCIIVCHNCHGEIHEGIVDNEIILKAHNNLLEALSEAKFKSHKEIIQEILQG